MEAFLYVWKNRANGMRYVGVHKGSPDDGYVCSSKRMMEEFEPSNFVRQIFATGSYPEMIEIEAKLLSLLQGSSNNAMYNLSNGNKDFRCFGPHSEEHKRKLAQSKIGDANPAKRPEVRKVLSDQKKGENHHFFGKERPEHAETMRVKKPDNLSFKGRKHTEETLAKMRASWVKRKNVKRSVLVES